MRIVVVEPAAAVLSLSECKRQLRVDHDDDDAQIESIARAAEQHLAAPDGWVGRSIGLQTLDLRMACFSEAFTLPCGPVASIERVAYLDAAGVEQTVNPSDYELRGWVLGSAFGRRFPSVAFQDEAVRIRYVAGYEPAAVPQPLKQALLLLVGHWYAQREAVNVGNIVTALPFAVEALATPYRIWSL